MNKNIVIETISQIAAENKIKININDLTTNLKDLGIDSLAMMNLIFKIESKLNIQLNDSILVNIKNLGELITAFEEELNIKK